METGIRITQQPGISEFGLRSAKLAEVLLNNKAHGNRAYVEIHRARAAERAGDFHTLSLQYGKDQLPGKAFSADWGLFQALFFPGFKRKRLLSGSGTAHPAPRALEGPSHRR